MKGVAKDSYLSQHSRKKFYINDTCLATAFARSLQVSVLPEPKEEHFKDL
jgi:hypothetical protein